MDSKTVFELRKEAQNLSGIEKLNKLNDALNISRKLYTEDNSDEWIQKAFAWVLIDLCKYYIADKNLNQAGVCFKELYTIDFQGNEDEIIENQKSFLRPKIDINYSEIQKAEELSKNGNNNEALAILKNLISQNRLTELHHESYGWIIYRYIKAEESNLSSVDVRTFLRDYMNLKNERPSMLHSMILNFALNYSKTHSDFKFYNFFLLWNPDNLRHEDLHDGHKDGKSIPSLISRICREFANSNIGINIEDLLSKINLRQETVLDFFRETIFWNIFNAHKENRFSDLWNLFEQYNANYSKHGQSKWHSEILNLAERFMKENDEWRFLNFFKNWNPENLRNDDWKETTKDKNTYKPLATKAIKKTFEVLKTQTSEHNSSWLIQPYEKAIQLFPDDEWLLREKALIHFKNNELESAVKIYKQLVLELANKHYVWQEFSDCIISDNSLKIGMLSKALSLEKNEDFLGDVHLDLAKVLIDENMLENALVELEVYKKHREIKGWKLSSLFDELHKKSSSVKQSLKDNQELYKKYIPFAENFAYADFDWTELVLVDKWKDDKGKDRLTFTDGKTIEFVIGKNRFEVFKQCELGHIYKFKLHKQEIKKEVENTYSWMSRNIVTEYKYFPLITEKSEKKNWTILDDTFAVVDYINNEKNIIHVITSDNKEVFFPQIKGELQIGDFITAKSYIKKVKDENRTELKDIQKIDKDSVISKYQTQIAIVDGVNEQKQLFHFVLNPKLQGVIKYSETRLRPNEGDFIKLSFATKTDKDKKLRVKVLNIEQTEETNTNLRKDIIGLLEVKYKDYNYDENIPDFAFIGDYYVPKYLLERHDIITDCKVNARAIYGEDKMKRPRWKVIGIEKLN
ncbi:tetratricopeptide repeat protein [Elizabethkingia occulta]|uniref:tetratricopeptide repeat protein n=1 Tax=Elizabethkingia occulta TaxID=1867263 RepID=UPI00398C6D25